MSAEWRKVLILCMQFLKEYRLVLPRFKKLYGQDGDLEPDAAYLQVQNDSFRFGSSSPPTILGYLKAAKLLVNWALACSRNFSTLSEFEVACFLKDQCPRGVSVPNGVYRGLIWFEKSMDVCLHTASPIVVSQSNPTREFAAAQAVTAEMATIKMLSDMEHFVKSAPTLPLRIYAGIMCTLGHGVLRWKDLQRSSQLHLTPDALVGVTWQMKKKKTQVPWAALRMGLNSDDWAGTWIDLMQSADMPGQDFVVYATSRDFCSFTSRIGAYSDGVNAMRALLIIAGMTPECALCFTLHSWRHLFPTAARQLRLPEHEQVEMGHWATGSGMPRRYDSAACVTELIAKTAVTSAFISGWQIADAGCIPSAPPSMSRCPAVAGEKHKKRKTQSPLVMTTDSAVTQSVRVVNYVSGKVHFWSYGKRTLCRKWLCGSPDEPSSNAVFADLQSSTTSTKSSNCLFCFGEKLNFLQISEKEDVDTLDDSDEFEDDV